MRIRSAEVPQADVLADVVAVAEAVAGGAQTYQHIAAHIGKVGRQGRYYRLAAEVLGLVRNLENHAELTPFGRRFVQAPAEHQDKLLLEAVMHARLFQRVIRFLEMHPAGVTKAELEHFVVGTTEPVGSTMIARRVSTVISWLQAVGVLRQADQRYVLVRDALQDMEPVEFSRGEPLLPPSSELNEYTVVAKRSQRAASTIEILRSEAASERGRAAHKQLVGLVAARLREAGALPRYNQYIDLAARVDEVPYIFEMKSTTPENARSQIRLGLSQLYEYRYLQNLPDATLALVAEMALARDIAWLKDYLEQDRGVCLLWDGAGNLYASRETREKLAFLW